LRRIKLGFVCLLTGVGISMILAGEEFGDQHDLFDSSANVTHQGGKQVDPVDFGRFDDPDRRDLFEYVKRLVQLRTSHPALSVNDTLFIHVDFSADKRVLVWKRGGEPTRSWWWPISPTSQHLTHWNGAPNTSCIIGRMHPLEPIGSR
jgi:pullulanase/glycogen debranching enzyme